MLYDILLLGIIVLAVIRGYKKGAAKTILSLSAVILSAILAVVFSRMLSDFIYDAFFRDALQSKVQSALENSVLSSVAQATTSVMSEIPSLIIAAMSFFGLSNSTFEKYCESSIRNHGVDASKLIADKLSPVVTGLIALVLSLVLFIVLYFILRLLVKPIAKIFKLPIIRKPDSILGGAIGLLKGIILVLLFAMLVKLMIPFIPAHWTFLNEESIENSFLFSFVYDGGLTSTIRNFIYRIG